jgi:hypothetical protein
MWYEISGNVIHRTGVSGTPTIPAGAIILNLQMIGTTATCTGFPDGAGGTITLGPPDANGFNYDPKHTGTRTATANQIAFVNTTFYFVEYLVPAGVSVV